jgi:glycogen debranching enzyme-like protein/amylo-alpha-1,6-glucosidase
MRLGQDVLANLEAAAAREWLLVNGLGGAASGTAAGAHTRRSHALLIAPDAQGIPAVALLKLDERLRVDSESFELGCNLIAGVRADGDPAAEPPVIARPAGHLLLEEFSADPWPIWRWRAGAATIEKSLFLVEGHQAVAVAYRHLDGPAAQLSVTPLVADRRPDALQLENGWHGAPQAVPGRVRISTTPKGTVLSLWHSGAFMPSRVWQRGFVYPADRETAPSGPKRRRPGGDEPAADAAFVPGYFECALPVGGSFHIVASVEQDLFRALAVEGRLGAPPPSTLGGCVDLLRRVEHDRVARGRRSAAAGADVTAREAAAAHRGKGEAPAPRPSPGPLVGAEDPWLARLSQALMDGLTRRGGRATLLTGLPAGAERGNETLRAIPALISLRAFDPAREVLSGYIEYLNEGLAPEGFEAGSGRPRYGDAAPALWLVHAVELLTRRSEDLESLRDPILPAIEGIMQAYRSGTRHGVHVGSEGLLSAGEGEEARCPADLNALWFHALVAVAQLARLAGRKESGAFYLAWAREHQVRSLEALWDDKRGCLYEALTPAGPRRGLSPSQLLAVSLSPPLVTGERAARLLETVERELFTPFGLRPAAGAATASPAWLGPFITAHLRVHQRSAEAQARTHGWLEDLRRWLDERSAVHVPESIAAPRRGDAAARRTMGPGAPPAQASVLAAAELLRVWIEEMDHTEAPAGVG